MLDLNSNQFAHPTIYSKVWEIPGAGNTFRKTLPDLGMPNVQMSLTIFDHSQKSFASHLLTLPDVRFKFLKRKVVNFGQVQGPSNASDIQDIIFSRELKVF